MSDSSELSAALASDHEETGLRAVEQIGMTDIGAFERSGLITNEQLGEYLRDALPPTHLERCPGIAYEPAPSADCPDALGLFETRTHRIEICGPPERFEHEPGGIQGVVVHEVGHNVHQNLVETRPEAAAAWEALHRQSVASGEGFVSTYASASAFEDFAESYKTYVIDPERLQFYSPEKYEFMRQIFAGQEHPPAVLAYWDYDSHGNRIEVTGTGVYDVKGNRIAWST